MDYIVYAKYSHIPTYTITYKPGTGGTGSQQTQTKQHGTSATLKGAIFTRTGYTQTGWATSDGGAKAYELGGTYSANANATLYPVWTAIPTYTVTFVDDDGSTVLKTETVYEGGNATPPANPSKTGHTFAGWSGSYTNVRANTTVTATYTRNTYAVSLHTNGGTINRGNVTSYTFGNGATLPTDVTRTGFAFGGWFAASDFSGDRIYDIASDATGDKTFYAKWVSKFTVTFEDHDGTVLKTETVPSGGDATPPEDPVREGYDFDRWDGNFTNVTSDRTITATYIVKHLTVTFKDFDGTVLKTETVNYGSAATAPTTPTHAGYTFTGWSRDFSRVTENIEVVAIYSGAANYTIRGRRWQRLYTAAKATPVYAAESDASLAARTICDVPWKETSGNFVSCLTAHPGTAETDEHNLANREYFDAAAFCAGHENGKHRVHAQATCYRFALPASAEDKRMNTLKLVVSGDPYLRDGARIAVLTNDTGVIPTDCSTCRNGDVHAEGVAKRTVSADGSRWYGKTDTLQFTPTGGLTLGKYLFIFVILENYAYSRGEYVEGSACIQPNLEIGMEETIPEWSTDGVNLCYDENLSQEFNVCRGAKLPPLASNVSGVQMAESSFEGDVVDETSVLALRTAYGLLYKGEAAQLSCVDYPSLKTGARPGAAFNVAAVREEGGLPSSGGWKVGKEGGRSWFCVTYGNGVFVAAGLEGLGLWRSTDGGRTWSQTNVKGGNWRTVAYGDGIWLAGSNDSGKPSTKPEYYGIYYSTDNGENWAQLQLGVSPGDMAVGTLMYGGGTFVCGSFDNQSLGMWYTAGTPFSLWLRPPFGTGGSGDPTNVFKWISSAYGNGVFVVGGTDVTSSTYSKGIAYSTTGGQSYVLSNITTGIWASIVFGDGVFIAGSWSNRGLYRSTDGGRTWSVISGKTSGNWKSLAYGNGMFVAGSGDNAGLWYSTDGGVTWTQFSGMETGTYGSLAFGNGVFVAGSDLSSSSANAGLWYLDSAAPTPTEDGLRWRIASSALFVRTSIPIDFHARKVRLDWADWSGTATAGSKFNVWVKPGDFSAEYDASAIKNHVIYDATGKSAGGFELIGVIAATDPSRTATLDLPELTGQTATFLLTAYVSMDGVNPTTGMQLPIGAATELTVDSVEKTVGGLSDTWRPDITLLG